METAIHFGNFNENQSSRSIVVYSSWKWVEELKGVDEYESSAYKDEKDE